MNAESLDQAMAWVGKSWQSHDRLEQERVTRLTHALGLKPAPPQLIIPLHWLYHLECVTPDEIGGDGHARLGISMPALPAKRRMFVGSKIDLARQPQWGDETTQQRSIASIDEKHGNVGTFYLVRVAREFSDSQGAFLNETQTMAYLDSWGSPRTAPKQKDDRPEPEFQATLTPDAVMLFKFSALTFNGHRIHYDQDYARNVEQYPGIVIHGPLSATMLSWYGAQWLGKCLTHFTFRTHAPFFLGEEMRFYGKKINDTEIDVWARTPDGQLGVSATAKA